MSNVTEVLVHTSGWLEKEQEEKLLGPLPFDTERGQSFGRLNTHEAGGYKIFGDGIYAAGFNYVSSDDVIEWLLTLDLPFAHVSVNCEGDKSLAIIQGKKLVIQYYEDNYTRNFDDPTHIVEVYPGVGVKEKGRQEIIDVAVSQPKRELPA